MNQEHKITPLMQQYHEIKQHYADALVLFQVGDFYELFFEDAKKASAFLGIVLTKRGKHEGQDIPLCGIPLHAVDHYLHKLIKGGFCVAICDQLEAPQPGKVVKRGVTQVLTPGTLTETKLLDERSASYLFSFFEAEGKWGLVFSELLTAQLYATIVPAGSYKTLDAELHRFFPDEVLIAQTAQQYQTYFKKQGYFTSCVTTTDGMREWVHRHFSATTREAIEREQALGSALELLYHYLRRTNEASLEAFAQIHFYEPDDFLMLDSATQRNLELLNNAQDGTRANTLLSVLDASSTAMGSRNLKKWLVRPLMNRTMIEHRLDAVEHLKKEHSLLQKVHKYLLHIGDVERVVGRIGLQRGHRSDYVHLMAVLDLLPEFKRLLETGTPVLLTMLGHSIADFSAVRALLTASLNDDQTKEWIIKEGFNERLDYLRRIIHDTHGALLELEQQEQKATGINSLKIRFNAVYGYYIEITQANLDNVPERYKRRQTLSNRERFTCPELTTLEHEITNARQEIEQLEAELFAHVKQQLVPYLSTVRKAMHALAQTDALAAFATCAYERGYTRPVLNDGHDILIKEGRHPVVAHKLGSAFIPNDTVLDDTQSLWVITGPNMGGKSTYLRQVAQLCIMAQCGSFVPAQSAQLPVLDRIFTRIGASDNVAEGKSTFLVEMEETAHICQYATAHSLVILDEVGRGTSTFDGLALAQAIIEYLFTRIKARCLFATHYHELSALEQTCPGIVNYHAESAQTPEGIVFLHKLVRGAADGSFGLEVAKLAQLPQTVIERAQQLEQELSKKQMTSSSFAQSGLVQLVERDHSRELAQLKAELEQLRAQLADLSNVDYDALSPKRAFDLLWQFKQRHL